MNNVLKQISVNLGVTGYDDSSLLIGIADYYGVNTTISNNLMGDILDAVGGNAALSNNYIQDIVIALGGPSTSLNWIEEWLAITATPPAPVNTVAPVISGTMVVGQTLTTTNGTWTNSPTSFTYQWYNGLSVILGATSSTYILVQADAGTTTAIKCEVTAINLGGSTAADSNTLTTVYDADAQAFITAAVITVLVQMTAINELTIGLKADSLWTSMKALYPFVGGTATTHKFNLKDPRDLDAAFRLSFNGGWTHSANGALPNGTNAYADTFLTPIANLSQNSTHISVYSRTDSISGVDIGVNTPNGLYILSRFAPGFYHANNSLESNVGLIAPTTSLGLFLNNRILSTEMSFWQNGIEQTDSTSPARISTGLSSYKIFLGAYNHTGVTAFVFSNRQQAFASIGAGLTDTDATNFYTAVQTFQTTLGRQV